MEENEIFGLSEQVQNIDVDDLDSEYVILVLLAIDTSGSMSKFSTVMVEELNKFKEEIAKSQEAENILVSRLDFYTNTKQSGYKKINDFDTGYLAGGNTVLYDAIVAGEAELTRYISELKQNGIRHRAIFAVFSDGEDTASRLDINDAKGAVKKLNDAEITTAYMEFGPLGLGRVLGFTNIEVSQSTDGSALRSMFGLLTTSVVSYSVKQTSQTDNFFDV